MTFHLPLECAAVFSPQSRKRQHHIEQDQQRCPKRYHLDRVAFCGCCPPVRHKPAILLVRDLHLGQTARNVSAAQSYTALRLDYPLGTSQDQTVDLALYAACPRSL